MKFLMFIKYIVIIIVVCGCVSCSKVPKRFELLDASKTHVDFRNTLTPSTDFNIFEYIYYYNGAGVATGDFNGDGLSDIYFTANQTDNKMYLNRGEMKFEDITVAANMAGAKGWKTGVSVADINADGKLDLYVCYYCKYPNGQRSNQLYINVGNNDKGIPQFEEKSAAYSLNIEGYGTQTAFFDYDRDGDLDAFLLNHAVKEERQFPNRALECAEINPLAGDKLLRNDNGKYIDVTAKSGIVANGIGYGLGLSVGDVNMDGWPDIYVGNDFHENDYLYLNKKDGTFEEVAQQRLGHTSQFTMGTEIVDVNNDALPDIFSVDMLPDDPKILKTAMNEDGIDLTNYKTKQGYSYQYSRNALQINLGNGYFSEIGLQSGVAATDWSWSALIADYDNDGYKDIFVANGIMRRSNDLDYMKFVSNAEIQRQIRPGQIKAEGLKLEASLPQVKLNNYFFGNNKDLTFKDLSADWCDSKPSFSNGAAYADFDNDGDLDLVVNNVAGEAFIYKNNSDYLDEKMQKTKHFLNIKFDGLGGNTQGVGAKIWIPNPDGTAILQEQEPVRGYLSSVDNIMHIGLGEMSKINELYVIWSDGKAQKLTNLEVDKQILLSQKNAGIEFDYKLINHTQDIVYQDISKVSGLDFVHQENNFNEFNREALMPFSCAAEGPAMAIGDVNNDGLEDVFLGNAKWKIGQLYTQNKNGSFGKSLQKDFERDSTYEDTAALFFDLDSDGDNDLLVGSGGNEYSTGDPNLVLRLYMNENGKFVRNTTQIPSLSLNNSCLRATDFEGDGDLDIFVGGRAVTSAYGELPQSYLLMNNKGVLEDKTAQICPQLSALGLVKDAVWADLNGDNKQDLIVVGDWMSPQLFLNQNGQLILQDNKNLASAKGFWQSIKASDMDGDGDMDLVLGNLGLNSKFRASSTEPMTMYYGDFDKNERKEQFLTYFIHGKIYPFATKDELTKQLPYLNKKYLQYRDFAKATPQEIIGAEKITNATIFTINTLSSVYVENKGNLQFEYHDLPFMAQLAPVRDIVLEDFNHDGKNDILLAGNFYYNTAQMGRADASFGAMFYGDGKGGFRHVSPSQTGVFVQGQTSKLGVLNNKKTNKKRLIFGRNGTSVAMLQEK